MQNFKYNPIQSFDLKSQQSFVAISRNIQKFLSYISFMKETIILKKYFEFTNKNFLLSNSKYVK